MTESARSGSWDLLARAAAREEGTAAPADLHQLLTFVLDEAPYALPVERVREIVRLVPITPVPRTPPAVRGVISLRGTVLQVLDLRARLSLPAAEPGRSSRIVVVEGGDGALAGLLVDRVTEVLRAGVDALRPAPPGEAEAVLALCVRRDEFVSLLDLDRVLEIDAGR